MQFPVTPGLVHVSVLPPADPDADSVPLHEVPVVGFVIVMVNVPANELVAAVPPTVPLLGTVPLVVCQVPPTAVPLCVRFMVTD